MSIQYDDYLYEHCSNVLHGLQWMRDNIPEIAKEDEWAVAFQHAKEHDISKYSEYEYRQYDEYFYNARGRSYHCVENFNYAWLHHIHNNPHHWQYWILFEDDPRYGERYRALAMPLPYILEMIADWWAFSWEAEKLDEIFNWWGEHQSKIVVHPETKVYILTILDALSKKLTEMGLIEHMPDMIGEDDEDDISEPEPVTEFEMVPIVPEGELAGPVVVTVTDISEEELTHYGVKGMKWGVRRYQNEDGTLTAEGKLHYSKTVFVSGSSKTESTDSDYYRKRNHQGTRRLYF